MELITRLVRSNRHSCLRTGDITVNVVDADMEIFPEDGQVWEALARAVVTLGHFRRAAAGAHTYVLRARRPCKTGNTHRVLKSAASPWPTAYIKANAVPLQTWTGAWGPRILRLQGFWDNRHMKVVRLSNLSTGRLYPQGDPWYSFLLKGVSTPVS
jgi:hypothetical protein